MASAEAETDPERALRQLAMLRALAEMGLELARLAKDDAVRQAEAANAANAAVGPATGEKRRDAKLLFVRLANGVRQTIAMERRIATGTPEPAIAASRADPRRRPVSAALLDHVAARCGVEEVSAMSDRAERCLRQALDADPGQALTAADFFIRVARAIGLPVRRDELPEALRDARRDDPVPARPAPP